MIISEYLDFLNEKGSAWKKKVSAGELSQNSIDRLKPLAKPEKEYYKGFKKGTKNIIKKNGIAVVYDKTANITGPLSHAQGDGFMRTRAIFQPKGNAKWFRLMMRLKGLHLSPRDWAKVKPMIDRHEADEILSFIRQYKKEKDNVTVVDFHKNGNKLVGRHMGIDVLKKEKENNNFQRRMYDSKPHEKFNKFRTKTGEYAIASKSKKEIDKIEKNISKLRKDKSDLLKKLTNNTHNKVHYSKIPLVAKIKAITSKIATNVKIQKALKTGVKLAI